MQIIHETIIYVGLLMYCYDGDTCKVQLENAPPFISKVTIRFEDFDTPEIRGKCSLEKTLAKKAKQITNQYMKDTGIVYTNAERGKYGRLLVTAPELKKELIKKELAHHYSGGRRKKWCLN